MAGASSPARSCRACTRPSSSSAGGRSSSTIALMSPTADCKVPCSLTEQATGCCGIPLGEVGGGGGGQAGGRQSRRQTVVQIASQPTAFFLAGAHELFTGQLQLGSARAQAGRQLQGMDRPAGLAGQVDEQGPVGGGQPVPVVVAHEQHPHLFAAVQHRQGEPMSRRCPALGGKREARFVADRDRDVRRSQRSPDGRHQQRGYVVLARRGGQLASRDRAARRTARPAGRRRAAAPAPATRRATVRTAPR